MPPFRIAARHPDRAHHDHAWHQVGGLFDSAEDAKAALDDGGAARAPVALPAEQRAVRGVAELTTERSEQGYELRVEELVPAKTGTDDNGAEIVVEHKWKDVN